ncbi:MAG: NYN domain-containing protein [Bacillota bacterium]|nr:NYN domain-containing protein [Bacillota bacterium]
MTSAVLSKMLKAFGAPRIDYHKLVQWACAGDALFRAYYYDCLPHQSADPTKEESERVSKAQRFFSALQDGPRFTVRLGRLEYRGTDDRGSPLFVQKRVDLQLGLDIASVVAKDRVATIAIVSGDSDLIPAVQFADEAAVIVRLVHGPERTYHRELWKLADERQELTAAVCQSLM